MHQAVVILGERGRSNLAVRAPSIALHRNNVGAEKIEDTIEFDRFRILGTVCRDATNPGRLRESTVFMTINETYRQQREP